MGAAAGRLAVVPALTVVAVLVASCSDGGAESGAGSDEPDPTSATTGAAVSEDCPGSTDELSGYPAEGYGAARSLTVCLYRAGGGSLEPTWSVELGPEAADQVVRAVALGRRTDCRAPASSDAQQVLLRVQTGNDFGSEPLWRDYLAKLDECPSVVDLTQGDLRGPPTTVDVTARVLAPIAGQGIEERLDLAELPDELAATLEPGG